MLHLEGGFIYGDRFKLVAEVKDPSFDAIFAAAPELLEALKAAMAHENHEDGKCGCCWTLKAEAAIAKAEKI